MRYLVVIPARGGSKGIPGKNIYPLCGKALMEYTLDLLEDFGHSNLDVVVSTDDDNIKRVAQKYDYVHVISRPAELSGDKASTESALIHAIDFMEKRYDKVYDAVITMQVTSPLRKKETFKRALSEYESNYPVYDALLSLNEDSTDFWYEVEQGIFERLFKNAPRRRQERKPLYKENSAYYITDIASLKKTNSVLGEKPNGFIISDIEAIDINEPVDLIIAETFLKERD